MVSFGVWFWDLGRAGGVRGLTKSSWGERNGPRKNWLREGITDHTKSIGKRVNGPRKKYWGEGARTAQKLVMGRGIDRAKSAVGRQQ